jgi:2-haloacid dehalogenase
MALRISDFDAVTFDVYGTLIDWEPAIVDFLRHWSHRHGIDRQDIELLMVFDRARAEIQRQRPAHLYPEVLRRCFDRLCRHFSVEASGEERDAFAAVPHTWPAYPDSHAGLVMLQSHLKVGALSNIDNSSFESACRRLDFTFDVVVTAERVGAYKPDRPHFDVAIAELEAFGIPPARILHVGQSLRADISPANKLGLKCVWINRPGRLLGLSGDGSNDAKPDLTVSTLSELVAVLTESARGYGRGGDSATVAGRCI